MGNTSATGIDMHNWDLVVAVTYDAINAGIRAKKVSPKSASYTSLNPKTKEPEVSIELALGDWQLRTGGAGDLVAMTIPLTSGTLTTLGKGGREFQLGSTVLPVSVRTEALRQLRDSSGWNRIAAPAGQTVIQMGDVSLPSVPDIDRFNVESLLSAIATEWLSANLDLFDFIFTDIDVSPDLSKFPAFTWIKPWFRAFAVQESATNPTTATSVFATLCLVDRPGLNGQDDRTEMDRRIAACGYLVDFGVIPPARNAGIAISDIVYLRHMVRPTLPLMFSGLTPPDIPTHFSIDEGGRRITNSQVLTMTDYVVKNVHVKPQVPVGNFQVSVQVDRLVYSLIGASGAFDASTNLNMDYEAEFGLKLEDDLTMSLLPLAGRAHVGHEQNQTWFDLEVAFLVIGAIATLVAAGLGSLSKVVKTRASNAITAEMAANPNMTRVAVAQALAVDIAMFTKTAATWETWGSRMAMVAVGASVLGLALLVPGVTMPILANEYSKGLNKPDFTMQEVADIFFKQMFKAIPVGDAEIKSVELRGALLFGLNIVRPQV